MKKLYIVDYTDDGDYQWRLIIAKDLQEAREVFEREIRPELDCDEKDEPYLDDIDIHEINEIMDHKITVSKKQHYMKYYLISYITGGGEHKYTDRGILSANDNNTACKKANRAKEIFERYGREYVCEVASIEEISAVDYEVLKKYLKNLDEYKRFTK